MGSTASMPLYLTGDDVGLLISHFNEDDEVAWLVPDGWGRWFAREQVEELCERAVLWHWSRGPLPLPGADGDGSGQRVADPFAGWDDPQPWRGRTVPDFGGHPGVYDLRITPSDSPYLKRPGQAGLSSISWTANYYSATGRSPHPLTERHWKAFRRWMAKAAAPLRLQEGSRRQPLPYAFPRALSAIEAGTPYETVPHAAVHAVVAGANRQVWPGSSRSS